MVQNAWGEVLLMDVKDRIGSIWHIPDKSYCDKYSINRKEPYFVAESFTEFLKLHIVNPSYRRKLQKDGFSQIGGKGTGVWRRD